MKKTALPFFCSNKNLPAQSIVEIVLSIGVAALVIGALVILGTVSLRTALSSARRTEATRLAVSGLEAMRFHRDVNGFSSISPGCYQITGVGVITQMSGTEGTCSQESEGWQQIDLTGSSSSDAIFERRIKVQTYGTGADADKMRKVLVTVKWPEGSGTQIGGDSNQRSVVMTLVLSEWE